MLYEKSSTINLPWTIHTHIVSSYASVGHPTYNPNWTLATYQYNTPLPALAGLNLINSSLVCSS